VSPRDIDKYHLENADALVVRSVKKITGDLLKQSSVKFVGTCTAGFDHLETDAIEALGITWHNAPGCNANSVVEYVFSALAAMDVPWWQSTVGIIGCGHVGGLLYRRLKQLSVECRCYDPFLTSDVNDDLVEFAKVLESDIICLHTPYTKAGPHPTHHLLNRENLSAPRVEKNSCPSGILASITIRINLDFSKQSLFQFENISEENPYLGRSF